MKTIKRVVILGMLLCVASTPCLFGTHPKKVLRSSYADFVGGELEGVSLTSDGKLISAPALVRQMDTREAFIYSAVADTRGRLYLGTGNNGRIFRMTGQDDSKEWAKLEEAGVYALAVDSANRVYAGTAPDGKVYRLDENGKPEIFFDPSDKYIWDLVLDAQNNLYVATGPRGIIYKVDSQGEGETYYDSEDTHIVELEWDLDGHLLAGSASEGLLYRISSAGKAFVLYDSPLEEVKSITLDRYGNVYAAILSGAETTKVPGNAAKSNNSSPGTESQVTVAGNRPGTKLEVCRIDKENLVETLYTSDEEIAFDLLVRNDGRLLIATGNKGRVLSVDSRRFVTLLVESGEEQVTSLIETGGDVYLATSNLGRVSKLEAQPAAKGVYEAEVLDAGVQAKWGQVRWSVLEPSDESVKLYTRSGNRKDPDGTWSEWEGPYENADGSQIRSAPARYLQWKVEFEPGARSTSLTSQQNALDLVSLSYMQSNLSPKVTNLTVHSPGVAFLKPPAVNPASGIPPGGPDGAHSRSLPKSVRELASPRPQAPPRRVFMAGVRSFTWQAVDPNSDDLVFDLYLRRQGETAWIPVVADLKESQYTVDGMSFPDGVYALKVVASDRASNPVSDAQADELISEAFAIANSIPSVEWDTPQVAGQNVTVSFEANTVSSSLYQVEYSLDGGDWWIVYPEDGIADQKQERFSIQLEGLQKGAHLLRVRVVDMVGNLGTHSLQLQIP